MTPQRAAAQLRPALEMLARDACAALHILNTTRDNQQLGMLLLDAAADLKHAATLFANTEEYSR